MSKIVDNWPHTITCDRVYEMYSRMSCYLSSVWPGDMPPCIWNTALSLHVSLRVNWFNLESLGRIIREAGISFQRGQKERAYFFNSLQTFNVIGLNLKRPFRRLQNKVRIRHCDNFPRIIYNNTKKCVRHTRSIKNIRNSAIYWGFL